MYSNRVLILIANLFVSSFLMYGQLSETYDFDTENKPGQINSHIKGDDFVIYCGNTFDKYEGQPHVTKIDASGNIIWTTTTLDTNEYDTTDDFYIDKMMLSGQYIYASFYRNQFSYEPNDVPKEIWKIDASNGVVIWKSPFFTNTNSTTLDHFIDYDENKLIVGYNEWDPNVFVIQNKITFIDKLSGDLLSTIVVGETNEIGFPSGLALDNEKKLYYADRKKIVKIDPLNPENIIWEKSYSSLDALDFQHIYIDENEYVFLIGRTSDSFKKSQLIRINKDDGNVVWNIREVNLTRTVTIHQDLIDKNGHLLFTWEYVQFGGDDSFLLSKVDKETGSLIWKKSYSIGNLSADPWDIGEHQSRSLDIDNNGDVYMTGGYSEEDDYKTKWGVVKINGETGDRIYDLTMSLDDEVETSGSGKAVYVLNDQLYSLGQSDGKVLLAEIENNTGNVIKRNFIGGNYKLPSSTIQIEDYVDDKTVVLKQIGRSAKVELYNSDNSLEWSRSFMKDYILFADNLKIAKNGNIFVAGHSALFSEEEPYYHSETENIHLVKIDPNGNLIDEYSILMEREGAFPIDIHPIENDEVILIYTRNPDMLSIKYGPNEIVDGRSFVWNRGIKTSQSNYTLDEEDNTFIFCKSSEFRKYDKATLDRVGKYALPTINNINFVDNLGSQTAIACGQDKNEMDGLIIFDRASLAPIQILSYEANSEMYKFVYNADSSSIYTIGTQEDVIAVKNISSQTGDLLWSKTYDCPQGIKDYPSDIAIDHSSNTLIITGYSETLSKSEVFIIEMDANGVITDSYLPQSSGQDYNNRGVCAHVINDESIWVGGEILGNNSYPSSFIYDLRNENAEGGSYIQGNTYLDENANGIKDISEKNLALFQVALEPSNSVQFTDMSGNYTYFLDEGTYTVEPVLLPNWEISSDSPSYQVELQRGDKIEGLDFGFVPITNIAKGRSHLTSGIARCFRDVDYYVNFKNEGTAIMNGTMSLIIDNATSIAEFKDEPDLVIDDQQFQWSFENLYPGELIQKRLSINMPSFEVDSIKTILRIEGDDINNGQNYFYELIENQQVVCAYDPNDKSVIPKREVDENYTSFDEDLIYTIRFQNTGNDTAFNVVILDTLDSSLNPSTLRVFSSSHMNVLETKMLEDKYLEFNFENILLPDSTINFNGSQGYVSFSIKPKSNLDENSPVTNSASIYFDFNPPIITNTVLNTMVSTLDGDQDGFYFWEECDDTNADINPDAVDIAGNGIDEDCNGEDLVTSTFELEGQKINIYPNPFIDKITIEQDGFLNVEAKIMTLTGNIIHEFILKEKNIIDLEQYPSGIYFLQLQSERNQITKRIVKY